MAGSVYFKSIVWLTALGGIGYGLLQITAPSEEKLSKIKQYSRATSLSEDEKRKILFLQKLKEVSTSESAPVGNTANGDRNK